MLVVGRGNKNAKIAFIGEAPGQEELRTGEPFKGPTGKMLCNQILGNNAIPEEACYFDNVMQTAPRGRNPTKNEILSAIPNLRLRLRDLPNINVFVAVGNVALQALSVFQYDGITKFRGSILKSRLLGKKLVPVVHPSFIMQGEHRYLHVAIADVERAYEESQTPELSLPKREHKILYDFGEACDFLESLTNFSGPIAFDVETGSLPCLGFATDISESFTIPFQSDDKPGLRSSEQRGALCGILARVFTKDRRIITQNGLFDTNVLWRDYGIEPENWQIHSDTMYQHQLLYPELPHSLAFISSIYTREPFYKDEGRAWKRGRDSEEGFFRYNGKDCCVTLESYLAMDEELLAIGQWEYFYRNLMPLVPILFRMYRRGIRVDVNVLSQMQIALRRRELIQRIKLCRKVGLDANPRSAIEMEVFLRQIGIKEKDFVRSPKTGKVKTDEDYLQRLYARTNKQELLDILAIRTSKVLQSGFTNFDLGSDGRYHAIFKLGPKSGRLASSGDGAGPQLQNIPVQPDNLRTIFVAPTGRRLIEVDLEQADVRVLAYAAPEPMLISMFESQDSDIHSQTCSLIFEIPRDEISKEGPHAQKRYLAKRIVHATNYGMGPRKFATVLRGDGIFISEKDAKNYQQSYLDRFNNVVAYQQTIRDTICRTRVLYDLLGRRHLFLGAFEDDTFREAYSRIPQATVAGLMALAMVKIEEAFEKEALTAQILIQVHDSLVVECDASEVEKTIFIMKQNLLIPLTAHGRVFQIPMEFKIADPARGESWGKMTKITA